MSQTQTTQPTVQKPKKIDPDKIKAGDLLAFVSYVKVDSVVRNNANPLEKPKMSLIDLDTNSKLEVQGSDLIEHALSADQFTTTTVVGKSDVAYILTSSYGKPFTVSFQKLDGTMRVMRGRLIHPENLMGRSYVEDLDIVNGQNRVRQVDHRTIEYLILDGTKYEVK